MSGDRYGKMSIAKMLDKSVYLHKSNIGTSALYLFVMSILVLVVGIISSIIIILPFSVIMTRGFMLGNSAFEIGFIISVFMFIFVMAVFYYLLEAIRQSGIIAIASNGFLNRRVDVADAIMSALKNIHRVLSVIIAGAILFLPVFLVCGGIIVLILSSFTYEKWTVYASITLISIVFFSTFMYFMTIHAFSIQIAIIEKTYFFNALKKSRKLVKGRFWRTLGCFISSNISVLAITLSIYSIFALIGGIIYTVISSSSIDSELLSMLLMLGNVARTPLQLLVSLFVSPISGIFMTILYYNMRFEKEGYDMELNILKLKNS